MAISSLNHGYGYLRDSLDARDYIFTARPEVLRALPPQVDHRTTGFMPAVYDQGQIGSCVGNACTSAFDFIHAKQGLGFLVPSRLFDYYNARDIEGHAGSDAGAQIRDGVKVLATLGTCPETEWPYDTSKVLVKPPAKDYTDALANQVLQYKSVPQTADQIKGALADNLPVVCGFAVYQGFENLPSNGIVPLPGPNERPLGGHAQHFCGYDATLSRSHETLYLSKNSWGTNWGLSGYSWFPESYVLNAQLFADFWALELVEAPTPPPPPTPTPSPFYVGPGIAKAMQAQNDQPASSEWYPTDSTGASKGFSIAYGQSGKEYIYIASLDRVAVYVPTAQV